MNFPQLRKRDEVLRLKRIIFETQKEVAQNNEKRVVEAFTTHCPDEFRTRWIYKARPATYEKDHNGIDIVFETDVGEINVRVKSSRRGVEKFRDQQGAGVFDTGIVPVVINVCYDHRDIRRIVKRELEFVRERRKQHPKTPA